MYGLVLEGGGAKGAYHVGAYKALRELKVDIGGIAGTSIGALNGAALIQGDIKHLEKLWMNTKASDLFDIDEKVLNDLKSFKLDELSLPYLINVSKEILANKGLDTSKIKALVADFIDEDKIRKSKLDYGIVTVNITDLKPMELLKEDIPEGELIDYILASANFPAFRQEPVNNKKFIDGGLYNNLPIGLLAKKGYTDIIAVRTYGIGRVKKYDDKNLNITYIQPVENLGGTLDFNRELAEYDMKLGYYDTMKVFKSLRGYKYYCQPYAGDFIDFMTGLLKDFEDRVIRLGSILGFTDMPPERMLFEKIMPRIESILDMKGSFDYQDIIIRLIESVAEKYKDVEKFKIYGAEEFISEVISKFRTNPLNKSKNIPTFVKRNKFLSLAVRDEIVTEIFRTIFFNE